MTEQQIFEGFTERCPAFFKDLAEHNEKGWFDSHREEYETEVLAPSRLLVTALGNRLKQIRPHIIVDPRVNRSLFRINRDTRFSKIKLPYKTHLGIVFWEGEKRLASPCFYLHLTPSSLMLAVGIHVFTPELLERYREAVDDRRSGEALADILDDIRQEGFDIGDAYYKRVPRGFSPDHPRADLLKFNGMGAMWTEDIPPSFYSADFVEYCFDRFREMDPINEWLASYVM